MSLHQKRPHLVCYDIADPGRLGRVHRYLKKTGLALQYSVFLLHVNARQLEKIHAALEQIIDPVEDDIRIYPLPLQPQWESFGQPMWPETFVPQTLPLPPESGMVE